MACICSIIESQTFRCFAKGLGEWGLDFFFSRIRMNILNQEGTWNSVKGSGADSVELRLVAIKVVSFRKVAR